MRRKYKAPAPARPTLLDDLQAVRRVASTIRLARREYILPSSLRDAVRELVAATAWFERSNTAAPSYPEEADTLRAMLAPLREDAEDS